MPASQVVRRRAGAVALAAAAVALVWLLLSGGGDSPPTDEEPLEAASAEERPDAADRAPTGAVADSELVDAVMLVGFKGTDAGPVVAELEDHPYGAVLVGPENWEGKGPGAELVAAIRDGVEGGPAPLIATAQEGGVYRSLSDLPPPEREIEIGDRGKPGLAASWGESTAKALAGAGFDLNLAPVADVATLDSAIADRAFSDDAEIAAEMTAAAVEGCENGGVACAIAHFPGLGSAAQSTDTGPAQVGLDLPTLQGRDLIPFLAGFEAGAPAVVVSHGLYVGIDPVNPASLSPEIATELLRDEIGFEGVAISDDIGAGAIVAVSDPGEAAVEAVNAGIDLVQVRDPGDVEAVRRALTTALESGELSEERLQEAGERIEALRDGLDEETKKKEKKEKKD